MKKDKNFLKIERTSIVKNDVKILRKLLEKFCDAIFYATAAGFGLDFNNHGKF